MLKGLVEAKFGGNCGPNDLFDSVGEVRGLKWGLIFLQFFVYGT